MGDENMTGYVTRREGGNDVILLTNSRREGSENPLTPITIGVAYVPPGEGGAQSRAIVGAEVGLLNTDNLMGFGVVFNIGDDILPTDMTRGRVRLRETIAVL
jgi:hypothetical protein